TRCSRCRCHADSTIAMPPCPMTPSTRYLCWRISPGRSALTVRDPTAWSASESRGCDGDLPERGGFRHGDPMSRPPLVLPLSSLLLLSGCCGGYSVVRTTMADQAQVKESGELIRSPASSVLHYSRLGEPPNSCGSEVKYAEDLWVQVPSLAPGQAYTIGAQGVTAVFARQVGEDTTHAAKIAGRGDIKEATGDGATVVLAVTVTLPAGETVKLDDNYAFHPLTAGRGPGPRGIADRGEVWTSSCAAL